MEHGYEDDETQYHRGPIPRDIAAEAMSLHANYQQQMKDLAVRARKPHRALFRLVGDIPKKHCQSTNWNMFQLWYSVEHADIIAQYRRDGGMS